MTANSPSPCRRTRRPCSKLAAATAFGRSPVTTRTAGRRCGHRPAGSGASQAALSQGASDLGHFDAVVSNATLHHLPDTGAALACLRRLVRPGGTLAIVTFARPGLRHWPWQLATLVIRGVVIRLRGKWERSAPTVWPPRFTVAELRRDVRAELPGARVSLLALGRMFIHWQAN